MINPITNPNVKHAVERLSNHQEDIRLLWNKYEQFMNNWINALESGEYKQGTGLLVNHKPELDDYVYCCLGVAACVNLPDSHPTDFTSDDFLYPTDHEIPDDYPEQLLGDVGLTSTLAGINDAHIDFEYIAEALRYLKP